jgi:hypothetical protein
MTNFYQPLHEELQARDALYAIRQRGSIDDYAKAFTLLVVKVPQNDNRGVTLPVHQGAQAAGPSQHRSPDAYYPRGGQMLASSADGILSQQRHYPGPSRFSTNQGSAPMELGAADLRRKRLEPAEFDRRRAATLCFECGNPDHRAYQHSADGFLT